MRIMILLLAFGALALFLLRKMSGMPDNLVVRRSIRIQAPPEAIFPLLQDFRRWTVWSPYEALDPKLKRTYGGAPFGEGAVYDWSGNGKAGSGRMQVTEAVAPSKLLIQLDIIRPFEARNTAAFVLRPDGDATEVTWSMRGPNPPISKLMSLFMDMDAMIGKDFAQGLANLKAAVEGA